VPSTEFFSPLHSTPLHFTSLGLLYSKNQRKQNNMRSSSSILLTPQKFAGQVYR